MASQQGRNFKFSKNFISAVKLLNLDEKKSLKFTDSLLLEASTPYEVVESKMISAYIWSNCGIYKKSIKVASNCLEMVSDNQDYYSKALIELFLAKQYREVDLSLLEKKYIDDAEKTISSLPLNKYTYCLKGELLIEKSRLLQGQLKNKEAIALLKRSKSLFKSSASNEEVKNKYLFVVNDLLGGSYHNIGDNSQSLFHYKEALKNAQLGNIIDKYRYARIYNGMTSAYLDMKDLSKSEVYLQKSLKLSENSNNYSNKLSIYSNAMKFYELKNNLDSLSDYSKKYISELTTLNANHKNALKFKISQSRDEKLDVKTTIYPYLAAGLLIIIIVIFITNNGLK